MKFIFCDNTLWGLINFRGEVIQHFVNLGHEVILIAPNDKEEQMKAQVPAHVRFIPINMERTTLNVLKDLQYLFTLWRIFRKEKPDYIFTYTIKPNIYGSIASRLAFCHSTAMLTGLGYIFINDSPVLRLARRFYKFGLQFADYLFVLNTYNKNLVEQKHLFPLEKTILLKGGEGINLQKYGTHSNDAPSITFLYVGRILWDKGYDEFSKAATIIKKQYPDVKFELLGALDKNYPNNVPTERIQEDEAKGILKYLGFTSDMKSVYAQPGLVITVPSYSEGMNMTLMEACAAGKPIITTNIPGCKEAVDDGINGFLIPPKDYLGLAEAMQKYIELNHEQKLKFSDASRLKAQERFDIRFTIQAYDHIIDKYKSNKNI